MPDQPQPDDRTTPDPVVTATWTQLHLAVGEWTPAGDDGVEVRVDDVTVGVTPAVITLAVRRTGSSLTLADAYRAGYGDGFGAEDVGKRAEVPDHLLAAPADDVARFRRVLMANKTGECPRAAVELLDMFDHFIGGQPSPATGTSPTH